MGVAVSNSRVIYPCKSIRGVSKMVSGCTLGNWATSALVLQNRWCLISARIWVWLKFNSLGTAGVCLLFHPPGFHSEPIPIFEPHPYPKMWLKMCRSMNGSHAKQRRRLAKSRATRIDFGATQEAKSEHVATASQSNRHSQKIRRQTKRTNTPLHLTSELRQL